LFSIKGIRGSGYRWLAALSSGANQLGSPHIIKLFRGSFALGYDENPRSSGTATESAAKAPLNLDDAGTELELCSFF
jgi:hypothetical protein